MNTLTEKPIKLIIFFLIFQATTWAKDHFEMKNPEQKVVQLRMAISRDEQTHGLSGLKPTEFKNTEGMLFINPEESARTFWMYDTYFNLDIIFLNKNLKVVGIEKNVPFHPGGAEPPAIYRTQTYHAQFVLETKANASFIKNLKNGDQLIFVGKSTLSEIISNTHLKQ
jgi:uncharacterized membrane protein (UPF0127 family)